MEISIRTLETDDYKAIYDLICNELGYTNLKVEDTFKRLDAIRNRKDYQTFVAVYDSKVIGFIGLFRGIAFNIEGEYLQIIALAVNKEYQNKGIGTHLLNKAEKYAKEEKIYTIAVNSGLHREKAHTFYERRGYVKKSYNFKKYLKEE
jgi:GNAT superfamily N-acetyltransferase